MPSSENHRPEEQPQPGRNTALPAETSQAGRAAQARFFLSSIVESSRDSIITIDFDGIITNWNKAAEALYGYPASEALGKPLAMLTLPEDLQQVLDNIDKIKYSERVELFDTVSVRKGGREIHLEIVMSPVRDDTGRVIGASTIARDVTERRLAEAALRQSEEQFRFAIEEAPIPVIIHAEDGEVLQVSRTWTELTGYTLEDLPNVNAWLNRTYGEGADAMRSYIQGLFDGTQRTFNVEFTIRTRCGADHHWSFSASSPGTLRDGRRFIVGTAVDITERKRREANLAFLAEITEEFSQPRKLNEIIQLVGDKIGAFLKIQYCHFTWIDEARDEVRYLYRWNDASVPPLPASVSLSAHVHDAFLKLVQAHQTVVSADTANDPRMKGEENARVGAGAFITVPFHQSGEWRYLFSVHDATPRQWRDDEIELVQELSSRLFPRLERVRAEEALRQSEARLAATFEALPSGIGFADSNGKLILSNRRMQYYLPTGFIPSRDATQLPRWKAWHSDGRPVEPNDFPTARALRGEHVVPGQEMLFTQDDGTRVWTQVSTVPVRDAKGNITGAASVITDIDAVKRAEEALRESEEKFRNLFNLMDEAYAVVELIADETGQWSDFLFIDANPVFMKHTAMEYPVGKTATELLGTPNPRWVQLYGQVLETGEPLRIEEGEPMLGRVFDLNIFRLDSVESRRVAVLFTDITERKRAEVTLRDSEQRLAAIFANAAVGMSEISLTGRFLRVNDELCRLLGRSRDELLNMGVADVTHPDDIPASFAAVRRVIESGQPSSLDKRYLRGSGSLLFANSSLTLLRDENGEPQSLLTVTVDYTARKLAEESQRESEERYRLLVEGTRDYAMFLMDPNRRIIHWNSGAERLFGWSREEAIGLSGDMIFVPEEVASGVPEEEMQTAIQEGAAADIRWHRRKDGSRFWTDGVNTCLKDENGNVRGFVKITRDATREKQADEALRQAHDELEQRVQERTAELQDEILQRHESDRAREQLLQRVVSAQEAERQRISLELHDQMGQQLTALLLGLRVLSITPDSREQIERLNKLGKDIMDQMHHLARALRPAVLDTMGLQSALREYVQEWSQQSGVEADLIVSGLPESFRLRPELETAVYRVVQESLTNVQRHAEATTVSVLLKRQNNTISAIIEDDGKGFEAALDEHGRPRQIANRLGILGMQERLDLVGGTLTIESTPGAGTTIYVTVPIERRSEPRGTTPASEEQASGEE